MGGGLQVGTELLNCNYAHIMIIENLDHSFVPRLHGKSLAPGNEANKNTEVRQ